MKRALGVLIACVAALSVQAETASAAYPPGGPTVGSSSAAPLPNAPITLSAAGFCAGGTITFTIGSTIAGTVVANGSGAGSVATTAPGTPGTYTVTATASGACTLTASMALTVVQPGTIPATGSTGISVSLRIAIISLVAGVALLAVASVRRRPRLAKAG